MEKAILKTLIYADIFDYPLTVFEIHKWLIGRKAQLREMKQVLDRLVKSYKVQVKSEYYVLFGRDELVAKRRRRKKQSEWYLKKAKALTTILKLIPWIKLVGVSGGLAMENADKVDDIDLILITNKKRLWISRFLALVLLSFTGQRRKVGESEHKTSGKLCLNILLEDSRLEQGSKDIFVAHEVLQMKVLWERGGIYGKYLEDNSWAFKFLPNWVGNSWEKAKQSEDSPSTIFNVLENLAKKFQLKIMQEPKGMERIEDGALYFHPSDIRKEILVKYKKTLAGLDK